MTPGTLYVVATPLGNLGDLSARAAEILCTVDLVAAEDTRRTRTLLQHVESTTRVLSCHAHSPEERLDRIARVVGEGGSVAMVTDAGTPSVSDPGAALVRRVRAVGGEVQSVPGPSAVTAALSVSGFPADRYIFIGFLPRRGPHRRKLLAEAAASHWTVVIFEAPGRLVTMLGDLAEKCGGERRAAVARELTKLHEELKIGTLTELAGYYQSRAPRGEVTVLLAGAPTAPTLPSPRAHERASELLAGGVSRKDAAARLATEFGLSRNEAYRMVTSS